jgi:hypothetical protein
MTLPAAVEIAAQAGRFDGEAPLKLGGRSTDDGGLGDQAAANLPDDAIQRDAGEGAEMFQDEPRAAVGAHFLDHFRAQVLATVVALIGGAADELAAGNAGSGLAMPDAPRRGAERAESATRGNFQGVIARRYILEVEGRIRIRRRGGLRCVQVTTLLSATEF